VWPDCAKLQFKIRPNMRLFRFHLVTLKLKQRIKNNWLKIFLSLTGFLNKIAEVILSDLSRRGIGLKTVTKSWSSCLKKIQLMNTEIYFKVEKKKYFNNKIKFIFFQVWLHSYILWNYYMTIFLAKCYKNSLENHQWK